VTDASSFYWELLPFKNHYSLLLITGLYAVIQRNSKSSLVRFPLLCSLNMNHTVVVNLNIIIINPLPYSECFSVFIKPSSYLVPKQPCEG
jgi:hypothetical protein